MVVHPFVGTSTASSTAPNEIITRPSRNNRYSQSISKLDQFQWLVLTSTLNGRSSLILRHPTSTCGSEIKLSRAIGCLLPLPNIWLVISIALSKSWEPIFGTLGGGIDSSSPALKVKWAGHVQHARHFRCASDQATLDHGTGVNLNQQERINAKLWVEAIPKKIGMMATSKVQLARICRRLRSWG